MSWVPVAANLTYTIQNRSLHHMYLLVAMSKAQMWKLVHTHTKVLNWHSTCHFPHVMHCIPMRVCMETGYLLIVGSVSLVFCSAASFWTHCGETEKSVSAFSGMRFDSPVQHDCHKLSDVRRIELVNVSRRAEPLLICLLAVVWREIRFNATHLISPSYHYDVGIACFRMSCPFTCIGTVSLFWSATRNTHLRTLAYLNRQWCQQLKDPSCSLKMKKKKQLQFSLRQGEHLCKRSPQSYHSRAFKSWLPRVARSNDITLSPEWSDSISWWLFCGRGMHSQFSCCDYWLPNHGIPESDLTIWECLFLGASQFGCCLLN